MFLEPKKKRFFTTHLTFYNLNLKLHIWFPGEIVLARKNSNSIQRIKTLEDINTIIKSTTTVNTEEKIITIYVRTGWLHI